MNSKLADTSWFDLLRQIERISLLFGSFSVTIAYAKHSHFHFHSTVHSMDSSFMDPRSRSAQADEVVVKFSLSLLFVRSVFVSDCAIITFLIVCSIHQQQCDWFESRCEFICDLPFDVIVARDFTTFPPFSLHSCRINSKLEYSTLFSLL